MSNDPRVEAYAALLVEACVDVQPGWQVLLSGGMLARPLFEAVSRQIGRKGAYVIPRLSLTGLVTNIPWAREAPKELLSTPAPIEAYGLDNADALIAVEAPENTRELSGLEAERLALLHAGLRPHMERLFTHELKWVGCQFPTPALAQDAGMSLGEFEDLLYGACLLDWDVERERMSRYADRFDEAEEVRVVAAGTDLNLSLAGRSGLVDAGGANMPGGEFFFSPVEDATEGTIAFSEFPAVYSGREVTGIRLRFEGGRVVDASADTNESFLLEMLDLDEGARGLGELGIGCNPGITRYMKNTLFDEKIDGTVHVALGNGLPEVGGTNVSQLHWDIVKDLREGGRIELDGEVVQESGRWLI
ncbi:MAG: aminopeptidase [Actinomycetota bacterium]|nr:aminopeptidase [Actinomycetota bacterium]MDQ2980938.1 aminopeptidase [Actinomycetota bacterium]